MNVLSLKWILEARNATAHAHDFDVLPVHSGQYLSKVVNQ